MTKMRRPKVEWDCCTGRRCGTAEIVVEQHEGDVIPVLREPMAARLCRLGEEKPSKTADIHLDGEQITADPRGQLLDDRVP